MTRKLIGIKLVPNVGEGAMTIGIYGVEPLGVGQDNLGDAVLRVLDAEAGVVIHLRAIMASWARRPQS